MDAARRRQAPAVEMTVAQVRQFLNTVASVEQARNLRSARVGDVINNTLGDFVLAELLSCVGLEMEQTASVYRLLKCCPTLVDKRESGATQPRFLHGMRAMMHKRAQSLNTQAYMFFIVSLIHTERIDCQPPLEGQRLLGRYGIFAVMLLPLFRIHSNRCYGSLLAFQTGGEVVFPINLSQCSSVLGSAISFGNIQLLAFLHTIVGVLDQHEQLIGEAAGQMLRSCHAVVQLLLSRCPTTQASDLNLMRLVLHQWAGFSFHAQLQVWELSGRIDPVTRTTAKRSSSNTEPIDNGSHSGGVRACELVSRLLRSLATSSNPIAELCWLIATVVTCGIPARQGLQALAVLNVRLAGSKCLRLGAQTGTSQQDDIVASLARRIADGFVTDVRFAVPQLAAAFAASHLLPNVVFAWAMDQSLLPNERTEFVALRAAHCLLSLMRTVKAMDAVVNLRSPHVEGNLSVHTCYIAFAACFAQWLMAAFRAAKNPMVVAHLLGVTLHASAVCPASVRGRFFALHIQMQQKLQLSVR